jgi:hypothetical protein
MKYHLMRIPLLQVPSVMPCFFITLLLVVVPPSVVLVDGFSAPTTPKTSPKTKTTTSNLHPKFSLLGKAIQTVESSPQDCLELAGRFWLPTDDNLPAHYYQQLIHHETRQRWASQLFTKLAAACVTTANAKNNPNMVNLQDERLTRLVLASALPPPSSPSPSKELTTKTSNDMDNHRPVVPKEGKWILESLHGLHAIVGRQQHQSSSSAALSLPAETLLGIQQLIQRALNLEESFSMDQACQLQWSIQGLQARISDLEQHPHHPNNSQEQQEALKQRLSELPFDIVPRGLDWNQLQMDDVDIDIDVDVDVCDQLLRSIPFSKETITTRQGISVTERRGTAWIANEGIGALAYSGKLMAPRPVPALVQAAMRRVEDTLATLHHLARRDGDDYGIVKEEDGTTRSSGRSNPPVGFFDCALCNHYADATAACKFHTDPEHGTHWHRTTVVVAAGSDRIFAFKPIETSWHEWDPSERARTRGGKEGESSSESSRSNDQKQVQAATTHLFAGDLVVMKDNCNDDFFHAVHAGDNNNNDDPGRISLVLKRAIGLQRGHGLQGQGRRSRRKQQQRQAGGGGPSSS